MDAERPGDDLGSSCQVAVELEALGFSAQPGYLEDLLRLRAFLPQPAGPCTLSLGSAFNQCASEKTGPNPQALLATCRQRGYPSREGSYEHWGKGYADTKTGHRLFFI